MVAKAGKQELAILAAANAGIVSILGGYEVGNNDMIWHLSKALDGILEAIKSWPGADTLKDNKWALNRVKQWQKKLGDYGEENSMSCLIYITHQSIVDIEERISMELDPLLPREKTVILCQKLNLLKPIFEHVEWCDNFLDEKGGRFDEYERGNKILDILYNEIDFDF
ncbi:hypothetical protein [Sulfurovum sp.]|uniref:hypothetical protein n=1 Tax=Sulfurovum sp. TaxID=1969726 RepID=UPI003565E44A